MVFMKAEYIYMAIAFLECAWFMFWAVAPKPFVDYGFDEKYVVSVKFPTILIHKVFLYI